MSGGCVPGDLAMVVRSRFPENIGRLVKVLAPAAGWDWEVEALQPLVVSYRSHIRPTTIGAGEHAGAFDRSLKPLRDKDGEDETLTWAGKPSTIDQPVEAR